MAQLKIGDKAPEFVTSDNKGNKVLLSALHGSKVVLYFYPKDDTPGCTAEACSLRDNFGTLASKGIKVYGVSADSAKSHNKFIEKYELPFPLLADEEKKVLQLYNAWGEKQMYGRTYEGVLRKTYLISENGVIEHIFEKVDTKNHAKQILDVLK